MVGIILLRLRPSNGGANIQLYRISNNTGVGNTDIRVSMYNNYKGLNTKQEMNPFVLTSSGLSMTSSTRSATINVLNSSFGFLRAQIIIQ